jgi:hypothetical protein
MMLRIIASYEMARIEMMAVAPAGKQIASGNAKKLGEMRN